jgi:hypothetical protein
MRKVGALKRLLHRLQCWLGEHHYHPIYGLHWSYKQGCRRWSAECTRCSKPTRLMSKRQLEAFIVKHKIQW